jgi:hypothetical protein
MKIGMTILLGIVGLLLIGLACTSEEPTSVTPSTTAVVEPTDVPEPTATTGLPAITTEECAYLGYAELVTETIENALNAFADLTGEASNDPTLMLSEDWQLAVVVQLGTFNATYEIATEAQPPDSLQPFHDTLLSSLRKLSDSGDLFAAGVDNLDPAKIAASADLMGKSNEDASRAVVLLDEFIAAHEGGC